MKRYFVLVRAILVEMKSKSVKEYPDVMKSAC